MLAHPALHHIGDGLLRTVARRLVQAVLSFDSWAQPVLAAGVRSGATDTRHLLFNAQGRDVDLRIRAQRERRGITRRPKKRLEDRLKHGPVLGP